MTSTNAAPSRPVFSAASHADLVARCAAASREFLDAPASEREATARRSAELLGEVLDACRTRAELDALDRGAKAGFAAWIPDAAVELVAQGREQEGVALLTRFCATLGHRPFSPELLAGLLKGMRCRPDGAIDLPLPELSRIVMRLLSEAGTPARMAQLDELLGRSMVDWHDRAADTLSAAGPIPLGDGRYHVVMARPTFGPDSAWEPGSKLPKVGRNSPCPCGSGRKLKRCCGRPAGAAPPATGGWMQ